MIPKPLKVSTSLVVAVVLLELVVPPLLLGMLLPMPIPLLPLPDMKGPPPIVLPLIPIEPPIVLGPNPIELPIELDPMLIVLPMVLGPIIEFPIELCPIIIEFPIVFGPIPIPIVFFPMGRIIPPPVRPEPYAGDEVIGGWLEGACMMPIM